MLVRDAQPADADAVAAVHVRSWQVGYRGLIPDELLDALRPQDRASRYRFGELDPLAPATIVALEAEAICGFATTGPSRDDAHGGAGELMALYVDPDRWGLGIGRTLLAQARTAMARAGFERALLWVLAGNARAERFYLIDGWAPTGERRQATVWGAAADEIGYARSLTPAAPRS